MRFSLSSLGLREKVAAALMAFAILPLVLLFAGYLFVIKGEIRGQAEAGMQMQAIALGDTLDTLLNERFRDIEMAVTGHPSASQPENWRPVDDTGKMVGIMNGEVRANAIYPLMMLVSPSGEVLGVNTVDPAGKKIDTAQLYGMNFAGESWLKDALSGKASKGGAGVAPVTMEQPAKHGALSRVYGGDGWAMAFSAPLKNSAGETVGVWVNFMDLGVIDTMVHQFFMASAAMTDSDIGTTKLHFDILGRDGAMLYSFRASSATEGKSLGTDVIGVQPDDQLRALIAKDVKGVSDTYIGKGEILAEKTARGNERFEGAGWRIVARASTAEALATGNTITWTILASLAVIALASLFIGLWFGGTLTKPILALAGRMRDLAKGDKQSPVPFIAKTDDIGEMARAVEGFREAAIAKDKAEDEARRQREAAEEERRRNDEIRRAAEQEQQLVVDNLAQALDNLASGDLTSRIQAAFAGKYEKLKVDFNEAVARLQDAMKLISSNTSGIRTGTDEISLASDDLSKRTEQQAASLEETAAALDQITATVRKTAGGARQASEVVAGARADAETTGQVVKAATTAMSEIEKSSQQIGQIIGVIDEIAFQTNLLALNAGVEAARAGDAGKGFAVVASEVRALAQRSAEAAKEIKALIHASSSQVGQGVDLVGKTGQALQRIVEKVAEIDSLVGEIAASAQEQATGLNEVNTAVNQMDQVTQQNAAMVEESTAATHSLAQETEELARLVSKFRIGEEPAARMTARTPAPVQRPLTRPAPMAAPAATISTPLAPPRPAATTPAMRTVQPGGGAARKPDVVEDGWEEF
ncbi:methyl-accepting chemotaxis protein [Caulobacter mirabilis]|nr:methyl-accepting chemotaxis protein [Caulobacter mirabilis]